MDRQLGRLIPVATTLGLTAALVSACDGDEAGGSGSGDVSSTFRDLCAKEQACTGEDFGFDTVDECVTDYTTYLEELTAECRQAVTNMVSCLASVGTCYSYVYDGTTYTDFGDENDACATQYDAMYSSCE